MNPRSDEYYLGVLLSPWVGLADDDESIARYHEFDVNSETDVKLIIERDLRASLESCSDEERDKIERAVHSLLTSEDFDFGSFYDDLLPPFDHPQNARDLLSWIWQVLFKKNKPQT